MQATVGNEQAQFRRVTNRWSGHNERIVVGVETSSSAQTVARRLTKSLYRIEDILRFVFPLLLSAIVTMTPLSASAQSSDPSCRVPGTTIQWELDHCFLDSGTDDELHPLVQACLALAPQQNDKQNCRRNLLLKRYRCLFLIQRGNFKGTLEKCIDSPQTIGRTVKNKGV